ncbi:unnamed protein product [Clonostachys byssicola]|uniref:Uncharacterized protein n=1 Tax=Clonostachys byssicola TaxID=160290 RepID=A0A9N9UKT9_9HYPO|nr:unnamed protein product [Clonostachys byssicola]
MHFVKTFISLFALSGFAIAELGGDFDAEYGLARREVETARDGYLAARDELLVAREEYMEKRDLLKKTGKCYKDGIMNLCGRPVKKKGAKKVEMEPCGPICPRGFDGKSCPCAK